MNTFTKDSFPAGRFRLRIEKPRAADVAGLVGFNVFCPRTGSHVSIEACATCEHCDALHLDPTDRDSFVTCRSELGEGVSRSELPFERIEARGSTFSGFKTPVSEIMTRNVVSVSADLGVDTLLGLFIERGISGAPVVDDDGKAVGIVSKSDIVREFYERDGREDRETVHLRTDAGFGLELGPGFQIERASHTTVGDIMMPMTFTLPESAPIAQAAALMAYEGIHRLPIVSNDATIVGLVSSLDILRWIARVDGYVLSAMTQAQRASR